MLSFPERFFHRLRPRQLKNGGPPPRFPHCRDRAVRRHAANRGLPSPKNKKSRHFGTETGTEELAHWEMIGAMLHQIMKCATPAAIRAAGLEGNFALHGCGIFPADPNGYNFTADYISVTGDPIADITFDMAAEQNSRATYEHILQLTDDPDIAAPIRFLRQREIVHFQRFGECLGILQHLKDPGCIL